MALGRTRAIAAIAARFLKCCFHPFQFLSTILLTIVMLFVYINIGQNSTDTSAEFDYDMEPRNLPATDISGFKLSHDTGSSKGFKLFHDTGSPDGFKLFLDTGSFDANKPGRVKGIRRIDDSIWNVRFHNDTIYSMPDCKNDMLLLILVISSPGNAARRQAIRHTWGYDPGYPNTTRYQTVFAVGGDALDSLTQQSIVSESATYGDVLIGKYIDVYRNLTFKVLHGMSWAFHYCNPQYLLKTDDDCFVDAEILSGVLQDKIPEQSRRHLFVGHVVVNAMVIRNPVHRWYLSFEDYPLPEYPPYASGFGYVISSLVLRQFLTMATVHRPFPIEDAYFGMLARRSGITVTNSSKFDQPIASYVECYRPYVVHGMTDPLYQYTYHEHALQNRDCPIEDGNPW